MKHLKCELARALGLRVLLEVLDLLDLQEIDLTHFSPCSPTNLIYHGWVVPDNLAENMHIQESMPHQRLFNCHDIEICIDIFRTLSANQRRRGAMLISESDVNRFHGQLRLYDTILSLDESTGVVKEWYGLAGKGHSTTLAVWNTEEETIEWMCSKSKWERRKDLHGIELKASTLHWDPISVKTQSSNGTLVWAGAFTETIRELGELLNFTLTFSSPSDGQWGAQVASNGTSTLWTGMVGELVEKRVDIAIGGLSMTLERAQVVNYSPRVVAWPITAIDLNPYHENYVGSIPNAISFTSFLKMFTIPSWTSIFVLSAMLLFGIFASKLLKIRGATVQDLLNAIGYGLTITASSIIGIGMAFQTTQYSMKLLQLITALFGLIIFTVYTSDLTAVMTVGNTLRMPETFDELYEEGYEVIASKGSLPVVVLKNAAENTGMNKIYKSRFSEIDWPSDLEPLIQTIVNDTKLIYFGSPIDIFNEDRLAPIKKFKDTAETSLRFAYQKDSQLTDLLNFHLVKMKQNGALDNILRKWLDFDRPVGDMTDRIFVQEAPPLAFANFFFPAFVLSLAVLVASVVAAMERLKRSPVLPLRINP